MPQGKPPISRRLARAVLADVLDHEVSGDALGLDPGVREEVVAHFVAAALTVKRSNTRDYGETIILTYVVPPDDDGKLGDA